MSTSRPALVKQKADSKNIATTIPDLLPAEPDIEKLIIGAIFASANPNHCFWYVSERVRESSLSLFKTRAMLAAMRNVASRGLAINRHTIIDELQRAGALDRIGSILEFTDGSAQLVNIDSYCTLVEESADRRRLFADLQNLQNRVIGRDPLDQITADAHELISAVRSKPDGSPIRDIKDLPIVSEMPEERIDFVVDGHFAYSTVNMLTGEPGCGKSTIALKLCYCVSTGTAFAGWDVKLGHALYIDCEQSRPIINEKFGRLGIRDGDRFRYWGPWAGTPPALNSPVLLQYVRECEPKPLIVCDSYIALHPGDENSSTETRAYISQARALANLGACVLFLHHTGKAESAKHYRGSSDIPADLDTGYLLANLGGNGQLGKIRLQSFKARFSVFTDSILEYVDGDFKSETRADVVSQTVTEQLVVLLQRHPRIKASEFEQRAARLNLGWSKARNFLKNGVAAGRIRRESGPHNQQFHSWIGGQDDAV